MRIRIRNIILTLLVIAVIVMLAQVFRPAPVVVIGMKTTLPDGDVLAYGWTSEYVYGLIRGGYAEYYSFLDWQHDSKTERCNVLLDDHPLYTRTGAIELRATPDRKRTWLVDTEHNQVLASLDRNTGEFHCSLSPSRSSEGNPDQPNIKMGEYPAWATPGGGRVLARMTGDDYQMVTRDYWRRRGSH